MSTEIKQAESIKSLMANEAVKAKFAEILGKNSSAFISSVTTLATTSSLKDCSPKSILSCAITAATLNLQVNPSLGYVAIIPFNSKEGKVATFMPQWKGLYQLAIRSGQFLAFNKATIYEGELKSIDKKTGAVDVSGKATSSNVVGYLAYFKLLSGFEKEVYMTMEEIKTHAKKFSKTFSNPSGVWATNFDAMAEKTVVKKLLAFAPMSVETKELMQAVTADMSTPNLNEETLEIEDFTYVDNDNNEVSNNPVDKDFGNANFDKKATETLKANDGKLGL